MESPAPRAAGRGRPSPAGSVSPEEARWFGRALAAVPTPHLTPLLDLGSSSAAYRRVAAPESESEIFAPLAGRGVAVHHVDLKPAPGVDVVGDVCDPAVQDRMRRLGVRAVMCTNLLEHVTDRAAVCRALEALLPSGGLLFLSVPRAYPYHPDPIDTGFRPDVDELGRLLPGFELLRGEVVPFGTYAAQLRRKQWLVPRDAYLLVAGLWGRNRWRVLRENYRFLRRPFEQSCAVLRRR